MEEVIYFICSGGLPMGKALRDFRVQSKLKEDAVLDILLSTRQPVI